MTSPRGLIFLIPPSTASLKTSSFILISFTGGHITGMLVEARTAFLKSSSLSNSSGEKALYSPVTEKLPLPLYH